MFAPHSAWRAEVTPADWHPAMTWVPRLKRVFGLKIETCEQCGSPVKVIASIEDPAVIVKILGQVAARGPPLEELGFP